MENKPQRQEDYVTTELQAQVQIMFARVPYMFTNSLLFNLVVADPGIAKH